MTEKPIELVRKRLQKYDLFLNDDIVSSIRECGSIVMKFDHGTKTLHFACLAHATHLWVCDVSSHKYLRQVKSVWMVKTVKRVTMKKALWNILAHMEVTSKISIVSKSF